MWGGGGGFGIETYSLLQLAETYVQKDDTSRPPPTNTAKLRDFSIRVTKCPLDVRHLASDPHVPLPPPPPRAESPQRMDDGYDACESASQLSDLDGEEEGPMAATHIPAEKVLSPEQRGLAAKKRTPTGRPGEEATESDSASPCNRMVSFSSPEYPVLWRRTGNRLGREAVRRVQSEEESKMESPMCVLHLAGSQGSDIDQSESDIPSTMENIAMEVGQALRESVVSDTESGTTSAGEKEACLHNIHSVLNIVHADYSFPVSEKNSKAIHLYNC